jgi:leader peptidase (prepilin peptidase) / N-methyltransferase
MTPESIEFFQGLEAGEIGFIFTGWVFILGLLVGSFLNVVIYRVPLGKSIVLPPSACTTCNTPLHWSQNLPVLSYLALRGRCRFCGSRYSIRYAALELLTGIFFLYCQLEYGFFSLMFFKVTILFCFCLIVFFIDLDHWIIPDGVNLAGTLVGLGFSLLLPFPKSEIMFVDYGEPLASFLWSLGGSVTGVAFFWSIQVVGLVVVKQEAMGGGDVKFAALIGAFLGPLVAFWSFLASFFLGAVFAVPLLLARKGGGKDPIPFGTFMAVAAVLFAICDHSKILEYLELSFVGNSYY